MKLGDYEACYDHSEYLDAPPEHVEYWLKFGREVRADAVARNYQERRGFRPTPAQGIRAQERGHLAEGLVKWGLWEEWELSASTFQRPDLKDTVGVRSIVAEHYGLPAYLTDKAENDWAPMVGVIILPGRERVSPWRCPGWDFQGEIRRKEFLIDPKNGRPLMYAKPQRLLRPLHELRYWLNKRGIPTRFYIQRTLKVS